MANDFDIIIVGAGIAGTTCALLCARAGLSVLLTERGDPPGSKNLSGGRLCAYAFDGLIADFTHQAPLERRITHEHLSLLTADGATTLRTPAPDCPSWSVLRARFDPWYAAQAEAAGASCLYGVTVSALHQENGRLAGIVCDGEVLRARVVVLAEGANSLLAQQHGLLPRPDPHTLALGIKETLALPAERLCERFQLEGNDGAAWLFSGQICGSKPAGAFLYTNRQSLSLGIVAPLASLRDGPTAAAALLGNLKQHPALRPLLKGAETLEYAAHLVPEGGLTAMPLQRAGDGWLLVGDALGTCINTGVTVRGMDTAVLNARAAASTLIAHCRGNRLPLHALYDSHLRDSTLWQQLQRYHALPALLRRESVYQAWPTFLHAVSQDLFRVSDAVAPPLWRSVLHHARRAGLGTLSADIVRSLRCL